MSTATPVRHGKAVRLASTLHLERADWLRLRNFGIGSSDAAASVGLSQYKSPLSLWLEKTLRKTPEDLSDKEAVIWGTALEPVLATVYAERTGFKVRRVNAVLQHPEHVFMLANLDREVVGHPDGPGVLEIKTAGYHSAPQWEDGIPVAYQCQVLHQLAVTGYAWADVAVLIGGQDFRIYRITRDDDKIADLIERETQFWLHVTDDTQPEPDGSVDSGNALQWLFPKDSGLQVDLSEMTGPNQLFADLILARQCREQAEAAEALLKQQMQNLLGSATAAVFRSGRISWKKARDSETTDLDRLQLEHPELINQYRKAVPGSRRFTVKTETRSQP